MRLASCVLTTLLLFSLLFSSPAHSVNGNIGIYSDQGRAVCSGDLGFQVPLQLYVYATTHGASSNGITGAEYSISTSAETDWFWQEDFTPATGNGAFTLGIGAITGSLPGINVAYGQCQPGYATHLQTITVFDFIGDFTGTPNVLYVEAHSTPGNPFFRCPLFTLCDDPAFTKMCLGDEITTDVCPFPPGATACFYSRSGRFVINPVNYCDCGWPLETCIPVAVEGRTWGEVKTLFKSTGL